jgi:hypothetical protein
VLYSTDSDSTSITPNSGMQGQGGEVQPPKGRLVTAGSEPGIRGGNNAVRDSGAQPSSNAVGAPRESEEGSAHGASGTRGDNGSNDAISINVEVGRQWDVGRNMIQLGATPNRMPLTMKHGIFGHRIPRRFKPVSRLWLLLRGVIMWLLWLERLDASYNNIHWNQEKLQNLVWMGLVDYGRLAWRKVLDKCKTHPSKSKATKDKFKIQWCSGGVFAEWLEERPRWRLVGPRSDFSS